MRIIICLRRKDLKSTHHLIYSGHDGGTELEGNQSLYSLMFDFLIMSAYHLFLFLTVSMSFFTAFRVTVSMK